MIQAFSQGCRDRRCIEDIAIYDPQTVGELMSIADKAAGAAEALMHMKERDRGVHRPQPGLDSEPSRSKRKNKPSRGGNGKKRKTDEVMGRFPRQTFRTTPEQKQ